MKYLIKLNAIFVVISLFSCSSTMMNIQRNNKATDKAISYFLDKNDNVFYLRSTYATKSSVWSYEKGNIVIKKLENGKEELIKYATSFNIELYNDLNSEYIFELDDCMELDGDLMGFQINNGELHEEHIFPVDINCIVEKQYKSKFISNLIKEIRTFIL